MNDIRRPVASPPPVTPPPTPVQPKSEPAAVATPLITPAEATSPASPKHNRGCLRAIIIGVSLLVVLGIIGGVFVYTFTLAPTNVAREFVVDLSHNQIDAAYSLTAQHFQDQYPRDKFEQTFVGASTIQDVTFNARNRSNNNATIGGYITTTTGQKVNATITLTYENKAWKITSYDFGQ